MQDISLRGYDCKISDDVLENSLLHFHKKIVTKRTKMLDGIKHQRFRVHHAQRTLLSEPPTPKAQIAQL